MTQIVKVFCFKIVKNTLLKFCKTKLKFSVSKQFLKKTVKNYILFYRKSDIQSINVCS